MHIVTHLTLLCLSIISVSAYAPPDSSRPNAPCDMTLASITNCFATIGQKWFINKDTIIHNVEISCFDQNIANETASCVCLTNGNKLTITNALISHTGVAGDSNLRFLEMGNDTTLKVTGAQIKRFGKNTTPGAGIFVGEMSNVSISLVDTDFTDNVGSTGAAMHIQGVPGSRTSLTIFDSKFIHNIAVRAAIFLFEVEVTVINTLVSGNKATSAGGGVCIHDSKAKFLFSEFSFNSALTGGALHAGYTGTVGSKQEMILIGTTFDQNTATENGNDLDCSDGNSTMSMSVLLVDTCMPPDNYNAPDPAICVIS